MVSLPAWYPLPRSLEEEQERIADGVREGMLELAAIETEERVRFYLELLSFPIDDINELLLDAQHEVRLEDPEKTVFEIRHAAALKLRQSLKAVLLRRRTADQSGM